MNDRRLSRWENDDVTQRRESIRPCYNSALLLEVLKAPFSHGA